MSESIAPSYRITVPTLNIVGLYVSSAPFSNFLEYIIVVFRSILILVGMLSHHFRTFLHHFRTPFLPNLAYLPEEIGFF